MAFRVNRGAPAGEPLLAQLRRMCDAAEAVSADEGEALYCPRPLEWFPNGLAWQWDGLCGWAVKKDARHRKLKAHLVWLQGCGALTRQEAVSMIPPLCLDVQPDHLVLDLCAAPGSKASQLVEMMHWSGSALPRGAVVANEIVGKRADVLAHTLGRLGSPTAVVTNVDAQFFPNLVEEAGVPLLFDRVLADVPCSGDGTLRKFPALWDKWTPRDALGLHPRQYTILCRGLDLLKVGGRLVYSTCSLNPIEDEAVVAAALRRYAGAVSLLPLPSLPGLVGSPGLGTWVVPHPDVSESACWGRFEDVPADLRERVRPSCFPAAPGTADGDMWRRHCGLCRRFLPHTADTGGFFVAVLTKTEAPAVLHKVASARGQGGRPVPAEELLEAEAEAETVPAPEEVSAPADEATPSTSSARPRRQKPLVPICDYQAVGPTDADWRAAAAFLGLDAAALGPHVFRRAGHEKRLHLLTDGAARVLRARARLTLRVLCAGVRAAERLREGRDGGPSAWRACQEGVQTLLSLGLRRRIELQSSILRRLLAAGELQLEDLMEAARAGSVRGLAALSSDSPADSPCLAELTSEVDHERLLAGSLVVTLLQQDAPGLAAVDPPLAVAALLSRRGLEVYAPRAEAKALLETLDFVEAPASQQDFVPSGSTDHAPSRKEGAVFVAPPRAAGEPGAVAAAVAA